MTKTKGGTQLVDLVLQANDVKNSVKTFSLSKKYVKRLVKISVLNIAYRRIDISQEEFEPKSYEKIPYMVFKRKSQNPFIRKYHTIGNGIMDAIDKDFLKEIFMYVVRKKNKGNQSYEPLETYHLKVKYNKEEGVNSNTKSNTVKEATMDFLKALTELPGKKWKEEDVDIHMEITYNNEAPRDYEPPNFEPAAEILSSNSTKFVNLGIVNTGFHKVSAYGRGRNFVESRASTPAPSVYQSEDRQDLNATTQEVVKEEKGMASKDTVIINQSVDTLFNNENISNISVSTENYLNCVCKWELPIEYEVIQCMKCYEHVHLACHGFLSSKAVNKKTFNCLKCSGDKNKNIDMVVKLRVILYGINLNKRIPDQLTLATKDERSYILEQLEKFSIRSSSAVSLDDINMNGLRKAMQLMFQLENSQYLE